MTDLIAYSADIVIYGGTSLAVTAAVQARRMDKSVLIVGPDEHLGGLTSSGLGWTDAGHQEVIGGLSREFYHRIWEKYQSDEAWPWQERSGFYKEENGRKKIDNKSETAWTFEPHIAESVFEDWITEYNIPVYRDEWLDRSLHGVELENGFIQSIRMLSGRIYSGKVFIDATYEGDLMATAGISYHIGREAASKYEEEWNGIQTGVLHHNHNFGLANLKIDPYQTSGDPSSGVLPRITIEDPGERGQADHRIQAYCYRMCLTNHPDNRVPFSRPNEYDPHQYDLLVRILEAGWNGTFTKFDPLPNQKTDTNNCGPFSTDNIGMNYDYPDASYERRREIIAEHNTYQKGIMYFYANDPRVPQKIRDCMNEWGLARDEFIDNDHWPHQLYIREARRMIGSYIMTEHDVLSKRLVPEPIGMGSYALDSHNTQRYIKPDGTVENEGDVGIHPKAPYGISYGSITPQLGECKNLLVPAALSSSHIAFGSIRMEPVFMILGQSAATAAVHSMDENCPIQDINYSDLKIRLIQDGQILNN
jgi:hypothetical protein